MTRRALFSIAVLAPLLSAAERPYDPKANPDEDLKAAVAAARAEKKNILVDVGGEWCSWCHRMDDFFAAHPDLLELRENNYVFFKVNYSPENKNQTFLSRYPKVAGYPHLFVLDSNGRLLQSQDTSALEEGKGYNLERFKAFLAKWAPAR